jgi:nitroreductase
MNFLDLVEKRYSCRAYRPDPVEDEKLQQVLEAARLAPSATNLQPYRFIVIHTAGREAELNRVYYQPWFVEAPIVICACGIPALAWRRADGKRFTDVDVAIAMDHLTLAATELGLGTCWVASFDVRAAHDVLGIPPGIEPLAFTPLGYSADQPGPKERKPLSELVRYENW